ncbi:MAG: alpha/beta fold hydrolase [Burkholderiales bacterium]
MPVTEEFFAVRGCRVRMVRAGRGPCLLYLHGANGPNLWSTFFEQLSERFEVIAPDHPGFGVSGDAPWMENIGDLAYFYLDFLQSQNLGNVYVVGHSMGGWLAAEIAVRATQRIASVTLMSAAGLRVPGHNGVDIFLLPPAELLGKHLFVNPQLAEAALAELATPKTPEQLDILIRNRTTAAQLCWHPRLNNPQLARWLHRIDVPTHLVWGDSDHIIPPEHGRAYQRLMPEAKLSFIADAGHSPQVEKPGELLAAMMAFYDEVQR